VLARNVAAEVDRSGDDVAAGEDGRPEATVLLTAFSLDLPMWFRCGSIRGIAPECAVRGVAFKTEIGRDAGHG
jgi:hypothetical protein